MGSQADDILEVYGGAVEGSFGVSIVLVQGGVSSVAFNATWESVEYEVADPEGFLQKRTSRDFVFQKIAPVISGAIVTPRAGDRIRLTENGEALEFEIVPMGARPAVETLPGGYRWKVRTKRVES